jgi:hypothetical protein
MPCVNRTLIETHQGTAGVDTNARLTNSLVWTIAPPSLMSAKVRGNNSNMTDICMLRQHRGPAHKSTTQQLPAENHAYN